MVGHTTNAGCQVLNGLFQAVREHWKLHGGPFRQSTAAVLLHGCYTGNVSITFNISKWIQEDTVHYAPVITCSEELEEISQLWNCNRIRPVRNNISPSGRPVIMNTCPELYGAQHYLCAVSRANVDSCLEECVLKSNITFDATVFELCTMIMDDHDL
ncbi:hypothetical protein MAR_021380 [Mya arenaria]|uniref:Uncharacterized protein n=1 Tax=Mya arenaria TaxID=6604 RepID=A0ABY7EFR9_MYAAR|nr:hypothetical protein MAR_021380 [Mya arenaria]